MSTLGSFGEKKVIETIIKAIRKRKLPLEIGDDATAITVASKYILFKIDTIVGKYSLLPGMNYRDLGWRIVTAAVSDIVVKGGRPLSLLMSITAPSDLELEKLIDIMKGADEAAEFYGTYIDGGDTNEGSELVLSCACIGSANKVIKRNPLREGDVIAVSGFFGYTGLGFQYLLEKKELPPSIKNVVLSKTYRPIARLDLVNVLEESSEYIRSSIDSSDGLAESLYQLIKCTGEGGIIVDNLPVHTTILNAIQDFDRLLRAVFYGGEEFEIIIAVKRGFENKVKKIFEKYNKDLIFIGNYRHKLDGVYFMKDQKRIHIERKGWEYFS